MQKVFGIRTADNINRDRLIDFLRGGAMLLVLLHHSVIPYGKYILAFHMPLFFVLSGYLVSITGGCDKPFGKFALKKFIRVMVPYFAFEAANLLIWFIISLIEHKSFYLGKSLLSIITCINSSEANGLYGRLWFLPCIFVAYIYVWVINKLFKGKKFAQILSILAMFAISFLTDKVLPFRLPLNIDTAFMAAGFMLLGMLFKDAIKILLNKGNNVYKIILAIGSILYLVYAVRFAYVKMWMYMNEYGEYTVTIGAAVAGCIAFLILGSYLYRALEKVQIIKHLFFWYGENSLATFPVHLTIKILILWYIPQLSPWYCMFFIMLILNIPIVNVITNYLPFMLGCGYKKTQRLKEKQKNDT